MDFVFNHITICYRVITYQKPFSKFDPKIYIETEKKILYLLLCDLILHIRKRNVLTSS